MKNLEETIVNGDAAPYEVAATQLDLPKAIQDFNQSTDKLRRKERALGATEKTQLLRLVDNNYIQKKMNTCALLFRLRQRLQSRKFKLDRLEHSYRKKRSERRLNEHTSDSVKHREPGIQQPAIKYNKLVKEMRDLITVRKAPKTAVAPEFIDTKNLFNLNVDDLIWQDIGLDEDEGALPPWLKDEDVCKGIKAMLEIDCCDEEDQQLVVEMQSLQEWFAEEWTVLMKTLGITDCQTIQYHLELRRRYLCRLCVLWQNALADHLAPLPMTWGPSEEELHEAQTWEASGSVDVEEGDYDAEFEAEVDPILTEQEETVALADVYRNTNDEDLYM
ncbi:hypothetical protein VKT23_006166 [Stygiomarasmius scandens]|uniref:Uncharacterized protein n=1 Tax=Marasmiellus scandens TaxID=2682957 RepID=A0ABR1JTW6_9AGAR